MNRQDLLQMLTYRRPAWSKTENQFIARYIDSAHVDMYADNFGNRILRTDGGKGKIMIACHTDTVHKHAGRQKIEIAGGLVGLPAKSQSNCLGADDTAGVYAALRMIEAGVKATFVFHRAEEIGGRGSSWLAKVYPEWIAEFDVCLSLDRRGKHDIITHQAWTRTASDLFAWSLADALDMAHMPADGIFTDSANYEYLIPECSNLSIGYQHEHTELETLDLEYLEQVIERLIQVDYSKLEVSRGLGDSLEEELEEDYWFLEDEPEDVWIKKEGTLLNRY